MEGSRWHFVLRLPVLADGRFAELMTWSLRLDLADEGGGFVRCLGWGVGIDRWTVLSILRRGGGGVRAMESLGIRHAMFSEGVSLPDEFSGKILLPGKFCCWVTFSGIFSLLKKRFGVFVADRRFGVFVVEQEIWGLAEEEIRVAEEGIRVAEGEIRVAEGEIQFLCCRGDSRC